MRDWTAKDYVKSLGDVFKESVESCKNRLTDIAKGGRVKELGNGVDLPETTAASALPGVLIRVVRPA